MLEGIEASRRAMLALLRKRGVLDENVLAAMVRVPRERFVPAALVGEAYADRPLPIERGQSISQPYIVAVMTAALELRPGDHVLEIGTGTGYAAAVLAELATHVDTIERIPELAATARVRLAAMGYSINVHTGDGTLGWPSHAPYDAIVVTAGGPRVPPALVEQLAPGGRLVMPVGDVEDQHLLRVTALDNGKCSTEDLGAVIFVPLVGVAGWPIRSELDALGAVPIRSSRRSRATLRLD